MIKTWQGKHYTAKLELRWPHWYEWGIITIILAGILWLLLK